MKTLLSINNYYYTRGGAEAVFLAHNEMFESHGWGVVPFCMQHEKNLPSEWDKYFVEEIELGHPYGPFERLHKSLKAIYSHEAKRKIGQVIDQVEPTIAHGHNIYHHISPAILSTLQAKGIPVVLTTHDLKIACPAYSMINERGICERCKGGRLYNATVNRCMHQSLALSVWVTAEAYLHKLLKSYSKYIDKFVVPSRFYIQKFIEWGWNEEDLVYIPNFIDASHIRQGREPRSGFVYFGRLSGEKGLETLIQASAISGESLKIIGSGPDESRLRTLVTDLNAPVEFLGFLSGEALFDRLRAAVAVILPSEWYENAPISVIEAFATGTPVIGADIGGIPELITPERGRVFEAFSVTALSEAISEFASIPQSELQIMGDAAREYVEEKHSRQAYFERTNDLYESILDGE